MRIRTLLSILFALAVVVSVAYLTQHNRELLQLPFQLSALRSVPLYAALLLAFLAGFLPVVTILVVQTLKKDLALRRQRRFDREARSLRGSYRRAVDLQEDGQLARAAGELEAVLAEQPEDFGALLRYGEVLRRQGKVGEAVDVHRRASVLYPQSVAVLYQLAADYEAEGAPDVAEQIRERILRDFPGLGLAVLRRRRNAAVAAQDWETANRQQERIAALSQEAGESVDEGVDRGLQRGLEFQRGVELLDGDRYDEAAAVFERIVSEAADFIPAWILLGETASLRGDPGAAVAAWRRGWETTGSPVFLQRIEDYFIENEEPLEAIATLRDIIAKADDDLLPRFFLGQLYARLEMHDEALKALQAIRSRVRESPSLLYLLGRLHERRGEQARAINAYLQGFRLAKLTTRHCDCRICGTLYDNWQARCDRCGAWNTIELDFGAELAESDEPPTRPRPVWPVYDLQ